MNKRNIEYEKKFKAYLLKGDFKRFYKICEAIGVIDNIKGLREGVTE
jgi:hypothetical protein